MSAACPQAVLCSPFLLENEDLYLTWRDAKLADYPRAVGDLIVEIDDPRRLRDSEFTALLARCRKANMALYVGKTGTDPDPEIPLALARRFGVQGLNRNWLADSSGLTSLTVAEDGPRRNFIPYTNRAIHWHTDGYYNLASAQVHSLFLHVVQRAAQGGENALMDHEIAYMLLRDRDPDYIRALMEPRALTIPARMQDGQIARKAQSGPVFSITPSGDLHMRYTARADNAIWADDPLTRAALGCLEEILASPSPFIFRGLLQPGMGLISNNVLHDRAAFTDNHIHKRHYYRARYFDRLAGTGVLA